MASNILNELERHPNHWHHHRAASDALKACAYAIKDTKSAARLVFMAIGFASLQEKSFVKEESRNLLTIGINMPSGHIAEALMILASKFLENKIPFPELLSPTLRRFSGHEHPAVRALILQRLPYLQSQYPDLGWDLFKRAMQDANGLWQTAESCLYYSYRNNFEKVAPLLDRIYHEGNNEDMETWGRISALSALSNRIDFVVWLESLKTRDVTAGWQGAASVWTHLENIKQHRDQCLAGIEAGLNANNEHAGIIAQKMEKLFYSNATSISIPIKLIRLFFTILEKNNENKHNGLFRFPQWLNATAHRDPEEAMAVTEIYLNYVQSTKPYLYDDENNFTQLMTCLFEEAEEREESDHGKMLKRVVSIQDRLLSSGLDSINDWLRAAERP